MPLHKLFNLYSYITSKLEKICGTFGGLTDKVSSINMSKE